MADLATIYEHPGSVRITHGVVFTTECDDRKVHPAHVGHHPLCDLDVF